MRDLKFCLTACLSHDLTKSLLASALLSLSGTIAAQTYGDPINVQILNPADTNRPVEVIDNICNERVLKQRIAAGASVSVQLCTVDMQGGDATVLDTLTNQQRRYQQVLDSAELQVPITVGRPVTRPPPYRSRRAELPHRAPRSDSLHTRQHCIILRSC
ncbi:hypothetical protein, partial [Rhabdochromatium marinum]|uniref:hypothetical protein n=1 Tax=Rhabdochromatium marinum TaxID=48729 RepID=UPI001907AD43